MAKYKIYAGLGGGFGGADYHGVYECANYDDAMLLAHDIACEDYDSYAGLHGIRDQYEIMEEDGLDEDEAYIVYEEERESWLDYYVEECDGSEDDE